MSIALASRVRNEMCYIQICIDEYEEGEICGRLYNAYYSDAIFFDNGMEMIRKMDAIFDQFGYPRPTMDLRSFRDEETPKLPRLKCSPMTVLKKHTSRGKLATFKTRIMFRQNASWQGLVKWLEEDVEENFASMLELLMLMNSIF